MKKALRYIDRLDDGGGTMMTAGIKAALDFPHDEDRLRVVSFMTDGYIGNEDEILAMIEKKLGSSRIFSSAFAALRLACSRLRSSATL